MCRRGKYVKRNVTTRGVTKRCRLSSLPNSALLYEHKRVGRGGYSCTHGAQINFGDLAPYLTYADNIEKYCALIKIDYKK
jgi:hypothetical protein